MEILQKSFPLCAPESNHLIRTRSHFLSESFGSFSQLSPVLRREETIGKRTDTRTKRKWHWLLLQNYSVFPGFIWQNPSSQLLLRWKPNSQRPTRTKVIQTTQEAPSCKKQPVELPPELGGGTNNFNLSSFLATVLVVKARNSNLKTISRFDCKNNIHFHTELIWKYDIWWPWKMMSWCQSCFVSKMPKKCRCPTIRSKDI